MLSSATKEHEGAVLVSALRQINIQQLEDAIIEIRRNDYVEETLQLEHAQQKFLASLHRSTEVLDIKYEDTHILVKIRVKKDMLDQIRSESLRTRSS